MRSDGARWPVPSWRGTAIVLGIGVVVLAIDQWAKWWAEHALAGKPPTQVLGEFLQFTFVRNPGGAFSIGTQYTWLFSVVATCVAITILFYARRVTSTWWLLALGLLVGGAVGNLVDRVIQPPGPGVGHVVDFLQLPNWPVFNVADMAVVGGASAIVILSLMGVEPAVPASSDPADDTTTPPAAVQSSAVEQGLTSEQTP